MASVFQIAKKNGKKDKVWRFKYKDSAGKWRYGIGWTDKQKTLDHARNLESDHRAIRKGEKAPPEAWLKHRNRPIAEILEEFMAWGRTQGGKYGRPWDKEHADHKMSRLEWWIKELALTRLADIELHKVEPITRRMLATGSTPKTVSLYVECLRSLCCWSVKRGLLPSNPLSGIARLDTRPQKPHRVLSDTEVAALLKVAPEPRRTWYLCALGTGFRMGELRQIRVHDLDILGPSILLVADFSKDRKDHRQYISRELANRLAELAQGRDPDERLLGMAYGHRPSVLIRNDYVAAKVMLSTPEGKATWHSLRKHFINQVVGAGYDLKTAMTLARHATAQLTMETYSKADPERLIQAAETTQKHVRDVSSQPPSCAGVARKIATSQTARRSIIRDNELQKDEMVEVRGVEPLTF